MKDKKAFTQRMGNFLAGKGFYVVLFICTAVIGISAWLLLFTGTNTEINQTDSIASSSHNSQEVMVSPNSLAPDAVEGKAPVSSKPTATPPAVSPSAVPKAAPNKAASEAEGESEEAMSNDPVFVWPLLGDIEVIYSVDELMFNQTLSDWRTHDGIDISGTLGAKVMAAADGTVIQVKTDDLLGTTVVIDHGNGLVSTYANLAKTPVVKEGDKVAMGAVIGAVGDTALTESATATHLHFSMTKNSEPVDPSKYLPKK